MNAAIVTSALAALAAWQALRPRGRIARSLAPPPAPGNPQGQVRPWPWLWPRLGSRHARRDHDTAGQVVCQLKALLAAGATPAAAWSRAAGIAVDSLGVPDPGQLAAKVGEQAAVGLTAATRLALGSGVPLGRVLQAVLDSLTAGWEAQSEREAALAGPQTTARVLMWLPAAGVGLGWALGADPVGTVLGGGIGTVAMGGGVACLLAGRAWTRRLIGAARRAGEAS
ncbi:MAG: hypothetical protein FWG11_01960 [Promicromonosporaceae bacterium]|nr:hypothetical protein [Promicromonosporaceae bacterium]